MHDPDAIEDFSCGTDVPRPIDFSCQIPLLVLVLEVYCYLFIIYSVVIGRLKFTSQCYRFSFKSIIKIMSLIVLITEHYL